MKKGKLIVLEGIDGCGKSTNVPIVQSILRELGVPSIATAEPGGTDLGRTLRGWIKTGNHDFSPEVLTMLMCTARLHHIEKVIKPVLNNGIAVVCDRYWSSTIAYQQIGMGVDGDDIIKIGELFNFSDYEPDLELYLKVPYTTTFARRGSNKDYFDSQGKDFFNKVTTAYDLIAKEVEFIETIDATKSLANVQSQIRQELYKLYPSKCGLQIK